jgi:hypothetical protein
LISAHEGVGRIFSNLEGVKIQLIGDKDLCLLTVYAAVLCIRFEISAIRLVLP